MSQPAGLHLALVCGSLVLGLSCGESPDTASRGESVPGLLSRLRQAEDARPTDDDGRRPLVAGLRSADTGVRRMAVRAVGRLEEAELIDLLAPLLADADPSVRAEAADAIGQAAFRDGARRALDVLDGRLDEETDPEVRGAICRTLGRLPYVAVHEIERAEAAILASLDGAPLAARVEMARGLESLVRRQLATRPPGAEAVRRLEALAGDSAPEADPDAARQAARVRRLAMAALVAAGAAGGQLERALDDDDEQVRRLAAQAVGRVGDREDLLDKARRDPSFNVRFELLRSLDAGTHPLACATALSLIDDPSDHVVLQALSSLSICAGSTRERAIARVERLLASGAPTGQFRGAHRYAHALVSLARLDPARARRFVGDAASSGIWQLRMYAARASALGDAARLEQLARDPHPNVAEAALESLRTAGDRRGDAPAVEALGREDYQLVRTAARALEGSPAPGAIPALLGALERISAEQRDTSRDPRVAILDRLAELGSAAEAPRIERYLTDFDPAIATRVAELLERWTGRPHDARPTPRPLAPLPSPDELEELSRLHVVLSVRELGDITLRLRPFDAPSNVARFVRRVREGYFDGLTFHRVVPNFVIQGGSPGANEFVGEGSYTRDEITSASHVRGTVGISTRGRDTGDGQIFVNLLDNPRLDHNYTIIAEVTHGLDVVDAVLEGDVIERARVDAAPH